jgi:dUTP pyrophosphatase
MVKVLLKKLSKSVKLPIYKTSGSSGLDIVANIESEIEIKPGEKKIIPTGISVAVPENYEIQIRPRSGLAAKHNLTVLNTPGTIDADYRGEIKVIIINHGQEIYRIVNGERIAQMVLCPVVKAEFEEVETLPITKRGGGGFGSTGAI